MIFISGGGLTAPPPSIYDSVLNANASYYFPRDPSEALAIVPREVVMTQNTSYPEN